MKVVLMKDVKKVGRAHETVDIADGHALNFLIPKKLAVAATVGARKEANLRQTQEKGRKEVSMKLLEGNFKTLAEARIVIRAKVNEKGHLYDSISAPEIVEAAKRDAGVDVPEDSIKLEKPIKEVGTFVVPISSGEMFGEFSVIVEAEE
jgi:large subunit ribosomal protein L9